MAENSAGRALKGESKVDGSWRLWEAATRDDVEAGSSGGCSGLLALSYFILGKASKTCELFLKLSRNSCLRC